MGTVMALSFSPTEPRRQLYADRGDDLVDDHVVRDVAREHGNVGRSIDGVAHLEKVGERCHRVLGLEERPVIAAPQPAGQHLEIGLEPDRDSFLLQRGTRLRVHERTAAGRQHRPRSSRRAITRASPARK